MVRVEWCGAGDDPSILVITLNRPERRNALNFETLVELRQLLADAAERRPRSIVLTGEPPAFCAGADLAGVEDEEFGETLLAVLHGFTELPAAVIGAIDGPALGAGTQLASVCDLRVATPQSTFGIPAARLGLAVDGWSVHRLTEQFTPAVARAMLLAAEVFDGRRLFAVGAVHRLGGLDDALAWAAELATLAPLTIAAHKLALEHAGRPAPPSDEVLASRLAAWASGDAAEGRLAFRQKRSPRFTGG